MIAGETVRQVRAGRLGETLAMTGLRNGPLLLAARHPASAFTDRLTVKVLRQEMDLAVKGAVKRVKDLIAAVPRPTCEEGSVKRGPRSVGGKSKGAGNDGTAGTRLTSVVSEPLKIDASAAKVGPARTKQVAVRVAPLGSFISPAETGVRENLGARAPRVKRGNPSVGAFKLTAKSPVEKLPPSGLLLSFKRAVRQAETPMGVRPTASA